jgi:hypothetical protein
MSEKAGRGIDLELAPDPFQEVPRQISMGRGGTPVLPTTTCRMGERFTEATVSRVCKPCNNHWMNDLEETSRSVLTMLIRGEAGQVDRKSAEDLAIWVAKTCFMAQLTHPASAAVPPKHYEWLYEHRTPPADTHIWALNIEGGDWALRMQHFCILYGERGQHDFSEPCNTYSTTIGLGRVAFCVMGTTKSSMVLPSLEMVTPLDAVRIWPDAQRFEWGDVTPLEDADVWLVSDLLRLWIGDDDDLFFGELMELGIRRSDRQ